MRCPHAKCWNIRKLIGENHTVSSHCFTPCALRTPSLGTHNVIWCFGAMLYFISMARRLQSSSVMGLLDKGDIVRKLFYILGQSASRCIQTIWEVINRRWQMVRVLWIWSDPRSFNFLFSLFFTLLHKWKFQSFRLFSFSLPTRLCMFFLTGPNEYLSSHT